VQDALIKILDKLDTFEGRSKFTTWAMTIGVRIAISEMRRKHFNDVSMDHLLSNSMQFEPVAEPTPADNEDEKSNMLAKMTELIETDLTTKQRHAMHSLLNGMPVEVFAEKMGSNRNAVYKLVHDARVKLRQGFEQAGYKAEDFNSVFA
jgi:RNA polymerase sigma-70 factor (ECF subfamily)